MKNQASDFLNAIFACTDTDSPISFEIDGVRDAHAGDGDFLQNNIGHLRVGPKTDAGVCFVFGIFENAQTEDSIDFPLKPTAILKKESTLLSVWAFKQPVDGGGLSPLTDALCMNATDEHIPVPGTDGWELLATNPDCLYTKDELMKAYGPEMFYDAMIVTPYNGADYPDETVITEGANVHSKQWKRETLTVGQLISNLSRHREGNKDGHAYVLGDMVEGQRLGTSVISSNFIGLDIDTGQPEDEVITKFKKSGCMGIICTTHSYGKTKSEFKRDAVMKYADDGKTINDETIRRYLLEEKKWRPSIANHAVYVDSVNIGLKKGIVCRFTHPAIPKLRIIAPLKKPFVIADEAPLQNDAMKKWAKVPEAFARLLGVDFDTSCTDPARLFYLPRHAKGADYKIWLFGGEYFDWRTLVLDDPMERLANLGNTASRAKTDEGRDLGSWWIERSKDFQIVKAIQNYAPDRDFGPCESGIIIECPFAGNHTDNKGREDTACLAINGTESRSGFLIVKCKHDGCKDKPGTEMIGKMIADGWFKKSVLDDEDFYEGDAKPALKSEKEGEATNEPKAPPMTLESVCAEIAAHGGKPSVETAQAILNRIEAQSDEKARTLLFATCEQNLIGKALKTLVARTRATANAKWRAEAAKADGPKKIETKLSLPSWAAGYATHEGRLFAHARGENGELGAPLHSPLWFAASTIYPDQVVGGKPTHGITIEFLNLDGELERRSFTRSDAAKSKGKEDIIAALSGAGVSFAATGASALLSGMLVSGRMEKSGTVFDYPGWRGDKFFVAPGGEVIGETDGDVSLSTPLPGFTRAGTFDAWREATAHAFEGELMEKAPHVAATLLLAFVSPLLDRAGEDSKILFLAGRTTRLKSDGCQLEGSAWAINVKPNGVLVSFNSTLNSLEQDGIKRSGCAFAIDETKMATAESLSDFIYRISSNAERGRMNEESLRWCLACVISSEKTLAEILREARVPFSPGLMSRVVELDCRGEFVSVAAVDALLPAFENYGHAGPLFVRQMQTEGYDRAKIVREVNAKVLVLVSGVSEAGLAQARRAARLVAYIALGGEIAQRAGLVPEGFNMDAFAGEIWAKASAGADTRTPVAARVIDALNKKFRDGTIPIYSRNGDALASGSDGAVIVAECHAGNYVGPVFVLPASTLAKLSGESPKDAAEILDGEGMMLRYEKDRIAWKAGRASWANIGNVTAYVIYARNVLGDSAEDMIEDHRRLRIPMGGVLPLVAEAVPTALAKAARH